MQSRLHTQVISKDRWTRLMADDVNLSRVVYVKLWLFAYLRLLLDFSLVSQKDKIRQK